MLTDKTWALLPLLSIIVISSQGQTRKGPYMEQASDKSETQKAQLTSPSD
jgi:hypothetical protein